IEVRPEIRVLHHHGASISGSTETSGRQSQALLWSDLLLWARKERGERWARRAAAALRLGARLRLLLRAVAQPFLPPPPRAAPRGPRPRRRPGGERRPPPRPRQPRVTKPRKRCRACFAPVAPWSVEDGARAPEAEGRALGLRPQSDPAR